MATSLDPGELGARVRHRRLGLSLTVRKAAQEAGVSAATFSRVERGDHLPDRENLLRLTAWAHVEMSELQKQRPVVKQGNRSPKRSLPEDVALHLRADPHLTPGDAEMLANLFRSAYETLRLRRSEPSG